MLGGASSSDGEKVFAGIHFVLFGFDSVSEAQYRSELVRRGGIDVGRYDLSCTHVIVSGRVYDDPVCVAARNDGKIVVTELWIEDSVDFAAVADANKILYRPVRDLNGIPGSESLFICLTGYQRQERDSIMKMVDLMGAHFSKPLIAAKVTHLICYKFEGEKYELAKRVNIKLVNHRWLEDCLKAWEILPIDNYKKSGWELEILEAEARDSDEETEEDSSVRQLAHVSITGGTSCLPRTMRMSTVSKPSSPAVGTLTIQQEVTALPKMPCHKIEDILMANQLLSTPCKENSFDRASDINCKALEELSNQNNMGGSHGSVKETSHYDAPVTSDNITNLNKESNRLTPDTTSKISTHSDAAEGKFGSPGCSRKKPRRSVSTEDVLGRIGSFQENLQVNGIPMLAPKQDVSNFLFGAVQSPTSFANLPHMEGSCGASPLKRKFAVSSIDPKSPESGFENFKPSALENSLAASTSAQFKNLLNNDKPQGKSGCPLSYEKNPSVVTVLASPMANQDRNSLKSNSTALKRKPVKRNSASRANDTACPFDGQMTDLFCNAASTRPQDNQRSASELLNLGTRGSDGTLSPIGCKWTNLDQDRNPVESTVSKMSISNIVNLGALSTDGKCADGMSPKCKTLKASLLKAPEQSLQPDKGDAPVTKLSNIQSGTRQTEKLMDERPSYFGDKDSGMRMLPNTADSGIHHNSSAKNLTKKAIAKKKLGCKLKSNAESNSKRTSAYSNASVNPDEFTLRPEKVKGTDLEQKDSDKDNEMAVKVSKDADMEDLVKGQNSACKGNSTNVGMDGAFHLIEKVIASESSPRLEKVKEPIFKETVDDGKNEMVKSVSTDVVMSEKVKKAHKPVNKISTKNAAMAVIQMSKVAEENKTEENGFAPVKSDKHGGLDLMVKYGPESGQRNKIIDETTSGQQQSHQHPKAISEPAWFILSGHRLQRKEFRLIISRLRGRLCNDSHHWSYKATHFIIPEPVRRTEKFFAAAASGRWILKTDYLTASKEAGKFLEEEPFEWHRSGFTEDAAINLEAPRRWRLLRERTGHGAFYGMRIIIYGETIVPPMDTLKRVVKAGDGTVLATSPPYTRFLKSGVDFAVISPGMPHVDSWIQEFFRHEIPCISADYLVEYVCKPGFPLDKRVLYQTHAWADKSFANLLSRSEEIVAADDSRMPSEDPDDLSCAVCGSRDRGEVMLICGDEEGFRGCGIGTHIDCCDPPFDAVPEEDWFCSKCTQRRVSKAPVKGRRKR